MGKARTPGLEHRIGGLEKQNITGNVSYDPENHELMVNLRAKKIKNIENDIPLQEIDGDPEGELLVVGWEAPTAQLHRQGRTCSQKATGFQEFTYVT